MERRPAGIGPSEDSFCRICSLIARLWGKKTVKNGPLRPIFSRRFPSPAGSQKQRSALRRCGIIYLARGAPAMAQVIDLDLSANKSSRGGQDAAPFTAQPNAVSSSIINTNPIKSPVVANTSCPLRCDSGMISWLMTNSMAPAAKPRPHGSNAAE